MCGVTPCPGSAPVQETFYPQLREMLDDRFAELSDEHFDAAFTEAFGEHVTPAEYEEFFGGLAKSLLPTLQAAAPGVLSGLAAGSALGPVGAVGGAILGGVGSALAHSNQQPSRRPQPTRAPQIGGPAPRVAANPLAALLADPQAAQLLAGLLGRPGRESVDSADAFDDEVWAEADEPWVAVSW